MKDVNVTIDQVTEGYYLLRRFNDNEKLTEITLISNKKELPELTGPVRYEAISLDSFVGEKIPEWDGHSNMTLYFNDDGLFDHWEKTAAVAVGA